jgi:hypothetical protein
LQYISELLIAPPKWRLGISTLHARITWVALRSSNENDDLCRVFEYVGRLVLLQLQTAR